MSLLSKIASFCMAQVSFESLLVSFVILNPSVDAWMMILRLTPGSVLWLLKVCVCVCVCVCVWVCA